MKGTNHITENETLHDPARTWAEILRGFRVGQHKVFKSTSARDLLNARNSISRWKAQHEGSNFRTKAYDGYFTITRTS